MGLANVPDPTPNVENDEGVVMWLIQNLNSDKELLFIMHFVRNFEESN